jgi:hypothetical protein
MVNRFFFFLLSSSFLSIITGLIMIGSFLTTGGGVGLRGGRESSLTSRLAAGSSEIVLPAGFAFLISLAFSGSFPFLSFTSSLTLAKFTSLISL